MSAGRRGPGESRRPLTDLLLRPLSPGERAEVLADLTELRRHRAAAGRRLVAAGWYWWELLRFAVRLRTSGRTAPVSRAPTASRGEGPVESLRRDLRFAVRSLLRAPGMALVAIPTLALAIGASTAVFSFADALMFRPLPVPNPDRLVALYHVSEKDGRSYPYFSYPDYQDLREADLSLSGVAAYTDIDVRVGEGVDAEPVQAQIVSGGYFSLLGVRPLLGRTFLPAEDRTEGTDPVVILSEDLWVRRFGRDPGVVGRSLVINGRPFTVVGVLPRSAPAADLESKPLLWVPLMMHAVVLPTFQAYGIDLFHSRGTQWLGLVARMDLGQQVAGLRRAVAAFAGRAATRYPETNKDWGMTAESLSRARSGPPGNSPLPRLTGLLAAVVAMVLLIACANVANLLLARATARSREMGIRVAIGAGRARLLRQLLTESLVLALLGGVGGVLLAWWAVTGLPSVAETFGLAGLDVRLDVRVLGFALVTTLVSGVVFGLAPAFRASAVDVVRSGWASGAERRDGRRRIPLGHALVAVQVAISLVLLVGAGLTLRTLWNLYSVPLGFDARAVRLAALDLSQSGYDAVRIAEAQDRLVQAARDLTGVRAASLTRISPFSSWRMANDILWEAGDTGGEMSRTNVDMNSVAPGYFSLLGIPVVAGRGFDDRDVAGGTGVAVINEALARRLWPGESPLGRRIWSWGANGKNTPLDVVGVVADGRYYRSWRTADRPFLFLPLSQSPAKSVFLLTRGADPGTPSPDALRHALLAAEPALPAPKTELVSEAQSASVAFERTSARILSLFGVLAGVIAAMGIYGVVSFHVSRRTREIGVRMALGARSPQVRRAVVAESAVPVLVGTAAGGLVALALGRFVAGLLFEVGPRDPLTFTAVAALLVGVGLLASFLPARRATRVDPLVALRTE